MRFTSITTMACAVLLMSTTAQALPAIPSSPADGNSAVIQVHGCHRSCEWGPARGWHRHSAACVPIRCVPRAVNPGRCFVDRFGIRRCRW